MTTLLDILTNRMEYNSGLAIYAERIGGEFRPESPARIGQAQFENGGVLDDAEYFANCESAIDEFWSYLQLTDDAQLDSVSEELRKEAAEWLIDEVNQEVRHR